MDHGQGQQPHNHCNEAFIPSTINGFKVKTSCFFNLGINCVLLIKEMFISLNMQLGGYEHQ